MEVTSLAFQWLRLSSSQCICLLTDEWVKKLWYIVYSGILLSHKKEQI